MKRITLFINSLLSGGAEHQISVLANFLAESKYDVTITTISDKQDHYQLNCSIKRERLGQKSKALSILSIWRYLYMLDTDCIIIYCQRNSFFALPALFFRSRKLKVICSERNLTVGKQGWIEKSLFHFLYKRADYIVPNSYSQKNYIERTAPWLRKKLFVITNYTSLDLFHYSEQPNNLRLRIGILCRYEKQKNCIGFIEAISLAKKRCGVEFKIYWYGNRQFENVQLQKYYNQIEATIKENNLQNVIFLNDAIKNVSQVIPSFDAICAPSFYEGFSNTIAEAICCGRPILCSNVSDNSIMVHDNVNGILFNPLNKESIAEALITFVSLPANERNAMGNMSRQIAEKLFDKDRFIKSYIDLIES